MAYRSASWSVARHYGLDRGSASRTGAIAPGYRADLVLLDDVKTCAIADVFVAGKPHAEIAVSTAAAAEILPSEGASIRAAEISAADLEGPVGQRARDRRHAGKDHHHPHGRGPRRRRRGRLSVLERHGHGSRPANGYVRGFGAKLDGAIGSSVGHDSHNLITMGSRAEDMAVALRALSEMGGGFCVVKRGALLASLALPIAGLMSRKTPAELSKALRELKSASRAIGCELPEPFLQLAFLSLPVIPSLKLTDKGLVDVDRFELIGVRAS